MADVKRIEEIAYETGRHALADQEALVAGIRQRTGTLVAAHALVASFVGATTLTAVGLDALAWVALTALTVGLILAAIVLAPWDLRFAFGAPDLYGMLAERAGSDTGSRSLGWLVEAGFGYQALRDANAPKVRWMSRLSGTLSALLVVQTLAWLVDLAR